MALNNNLTNYNSKATLEQDGKYLQYQYCGWLNFRRVPIFRGFRGGSNPRNLVPTKKGFSV